MGFVHVRQELYQLHYIPRSPSSQYTSCWTGYPICFTNRFTKSLWGEILQSESESGWSRRKAAPGEDELPLWTLDPPLVMPAFLSRFLWCVTMSPTGRQGSLGGATTPSKEQRNRQEVRRQQRIHLNVSWDSKENFLSPSLESSHVFIGTMAHSLQTPWVTLGQGDESAAQVEQSERKRRRHYKAKVVCLKLDLEKCPPLKIKLNILIITTFENWK